MDFGVTGVAAITALCYLMGLLVKALNLQHKWIPFLCGITGMLLGLLAAFTGMPGFPGADPITAAAVGAVSGLAATGLDQTVRQLQK